MITCSHRGRTSRWEKVVAVFRLFLVFELGSPDYDENGDYDAKDNGQKDENCTRWREDYCSGGGKLSM